MAEKFTDAEVQEIKEIYQSYLKVKHAYDILPFRAVAPEGANSLCQMRKYPVVFESEIKWASMMFEE